MIYYGANDYRDYLSHHGVVGMHWGIRRYQPYSVAPRASGKGGKEIGQAKTGVFQRARIRMGYNRQDTVNRYINTARAKGIVNKASAFAGHHRGQKRAENRQHMHERLADASRTKMGKRYHEWRAANYNYQSQYHQNKRSMSIGRRLIEDGVINQTYAKRPYQRLSGRTTTIGKEYVDRILTGGMYGLYKDIKYKRDMSGKTEKRLQKKIDRIESKDARRQEKIMAGRAKVRSRMESGKKNLLSSNLDDFDKGTANIKKAMSETTRRRTAALKMKKAAVKDPSIKRTAEYKQAKKDTRRQKIADSYYGTKLTADMVQAGKYAREELKEEKRKKKQG